MDGWWTTHAEAGHEDEQSLERHPFGRWRLGIATTIGIWTVLLLVDPIPVSAMPLKIFGISGGGNGGVIRGMVALEADVVGSPERVDFVLAGPTEICWTDRTEPYATGGDRHGTAGFWDSSAVADGIYTLTVTAVRGGDHASYTERLTIRNGSGTDQFGTRS
jgi:hypothetical protein